MAPEAAAAPPSREALEAWTDQGAALHVEPWLDTLLNSPKPDEVLLGIRAWRQLGAERSADALTLHLGRRHPEHAGALVAMMRIVLANRGCHAFWRRRERLAWPATASTADHAQWRSLQGVWLAELRDATPALALQREALASQPDHAWLWVEHSHALRMLDQREAALDAVQQALALTPGLRTAVLQAARLLHELQRVDEAQAMLQRSLDDTGGASFAWVLQGLASEANDHERALALVEQTAQGLPRADRSWQRALAARRADACLGLGRWAEAQAHAATLPAGSFHARLAERLTQALAGHETLPRPTQWPLAMVQQHWMTCAPATLSALAGHWGRAADHLEVAQAICYDGTPQASERQWAADQGFLVRECKLDWPTACALIGAGVPFALATQHVAGGHLQAVVGVDPLRRSLLVRDPGQPWHVEHDADALLAQQQSGGPRAMVMLPPDQAHRLDGITLPEAAAWDLGHALLAALQRHDRPAAQQALEALQRDHPDSDSHWRAVRHLAVYDGDEPRILAATEALLQRYPDDRRLQLSRLSSLHAVQGQAAADAWLAQLMQRPDVDVALLTRWARHLAADARRQPLALATLTQALRRDGANGITWGTLADLLWQQHGATSALQALRWASCLQPTDEWAAAQYARACRVAGDPETGLAWLRERLQTWGDRSGQPAVTLAEALDNLQREPEAEAVLSIAMDRRPQDTALRLALAERRLTQQRLAEADALLQGCTDVHAPALLRQRALLSEEQGALPEALASAREAVAQQPLEPANHRLLLRLLRRSHGDAQALAQWRPLVEAHPANPALQRMLYDALPDEPAAINAQLAHMHQHHPDWPWLQRERAVQASRQDRHDEAVALARAAVELAPRDTTTLDVLGYCCLRRDGHAAALPQLQAAVAQDAEHDGAVSRLLDGPDLASRRAAMDFWAAQLQQQVLLGDGLLSLQLDGPRIWPDDQVLALLRSLRQRWPTHWQGQVAEARQLMRMQRTGEALALLADASQRFAQLPRVHLEHADALRLDGRIDEALRANAAALALSPGWNRAVRLQVDMLAMDTERWAQAEAVVHTALATRHAWNDADLIGLLAWLQERQGRDDDALATARRSLLHDPQQAWVWAMADRICRRAERPAAFDTLIDDVVRSRPGDADAWVVQAEHGRDDAAALAAAEQATRLRPRHVGAWLARFERLARLSRFDDIQALLGQLPWPGPAPLDLRAWGPRCLWEQQQRGDAVAGLRQLCAEAPEDETLCVLLADWLDSTDDHEGYLTQAQALMGVAPLEARSHAYLGHALSKNKRWAEALAPLQRALALVPNYTFAARQLVQVAREAGQPAHAEPALQALWPHRLNVATACDGIEAAAAAGTFEVARVWLERLMGLEEFDLKRSRAALAACRDAGWGRALEPLLDAQVARGGGPVGIPMDWLQRRSRRFGAWLAYAQAWRMQRHAQGPHLLLALMRWSVERESRLMLGLLLWCHEQPLRTHGVTWGEASYALVSLNAHRRTCDWLSDWRTRDRSQCPVYAMGNLAGSLAVLGRWPALDEVVKATLERVPTQEDMRLWLLLRQAHQGDLAALEAGLARRHEWTPDKWMNTPLQALEAFARLARERAAGDSVQRLRSHLVPAGPPQARALQRALRHRAMWHHTPWTRLWRWLLPQ